jgi:hypothetical protein
VQRRGPSLGLARLERLVLERTGRGGQLRRRRHLLDGVRARRRLDTTTSGPADHVDLGETRNAGRPRFVVHEQEGGAAE